MKKIKIIPNEGISLKTVLQKESSTNSEVDNPFYHVFKKLEKNYIILEENSNEKPDFVIHWGFVIDEIYKYRNSINIYLAFEPEIVDRNHSREKIRKYLRYYDYIMVWNEDIIDNDRIFKMNYMYNFKDLNIKHLDFKELKLLVNISGNKHSKNSKELYSERIKTIKYYENKPKDFELYGIGWENEKYKNYKGIVDKKSSIYRKFKFALSLENMNGRGYITEKIFDCFVTGIVPVYSGGNENYIPKNCYINYFDFKTQEELYNYLKNMKKEEWEEYRKNIQKWLKSDKAKYFKEDYFINELEKIFSKNKRIGNLLIVLKKIENHFKSSENRKKTINLWKVYLKGLIK